MASAALPRPPTCSPEPLLEAARQGWGCREGGKGRARWMEGTSQWAARWQLRKRPVFTFLLKEIVCILPRRVREAGREHARGGVLSHPLCLASLPSLRGVQPACVEGWAAWHRGERIVRPRTGCVILGKSLHVPGPQFSHLQRGSVILVSLPGTLPASVK